MRIAAAGLVLTLSFSSCNCGPPLKTAQGDLQVVPLALDFGQREAGSVTDLSVELTNIGEASLTVSQIAIEGDTRSAFLVGAMLEPLGAGESVMLQVRYRAPPNEGPDGATLRIESNAKTSPIVRVSLLGRSLQPRVDSGTPDAGAPDAGAPDAGPPDAGEPDAGAPDAGEADAGTPDAGFFDPDAGPDDAGCYPRIPSGSIAVANGNTSSPALSGTGVFVSYACNQAYGFAPDSGAQLWHHTSSCSGGGGKNVALFGGRLYTRDSMGNLMLDAANGMELSRYSSRYMRRSWWVLT